MKTTFVVSENGSCCASYPVRVFHTLEAAKSWIEKQENREDYDWEEVEVED